MTETKFTPGPWQVYDGDRGVLAGKEGDYSPIGGCGCCGSPWIQGEDGGVHNAHLIAAAPELFKALDGILDELEIYVALFGEGLFTEPVIREAKQAIAKARGKL